MQQFIFEYWLGFYYRKIGTIKKKKHRRKEIGCKNRLESFVRTRDCYISSHKSPSMIVKTDNVIFVMLGSHY